MTAKPLALLQEISLSGLGTAGDLGSVAVRLGLDIAHRLPRPQVTAQKRDLLANGDKVSRGSPEPRRF